MSILADYFLGLYVAAGLYCAVRNIIETTPQQVATKARVALRMGLLMMNFFVGPIGLFYRLFKYIVRTWR